MKCRLSLRTKLASTFFLIFSLISLSAEFWSNSRPLIMVRHRQLYFPAFQRISPFQLGLRDTGLLVVDYRSLKVDGWALWPLNRWNPYESNKTAAEFPSPPSKSNWLGTDDRGRDIFARILYGFRYSLIFALGVWLISSIFAIFYGGLSGYYGGYMDLCAQRITEAMVMLPQLLTLMLLLSLIGTSFSLLIIVSCLFNWMDLSRYVRGEVLRTKAQSFVECAKSLGASELHVFFRHILPYSLIPVLTFAPFAIMANIVSLTGLDYLGLGIQPPTPSWGELLQQGENYFHRAWWLAVFPCGALFLVLLSLTYIADGLRNRLSGTFAGQS